MYVILFIFFRRANWVCLSTFVTFLTTTAFREPTTTINDPHPTFHHPLIH